MSHVERQIPHEASTTMHFGHRYRPMKSRSEIGMNCRTSCLTILVCILSFTCGCRNRMEAVDNAIIAGDLAKLQSLLAADPSLIGAKDKKDLTPLMVAAAMGNLDAAKLLLDRGAPLEEKDDKKFTALLLAASEGQTDVVKLLLEKGAQVDARTYEGATPLTFAASKGHPDVAMSLMEKGATVDARDNVGRTPLMMAALNGHIDVVVRLLAKGAAVDAKDNNGLTAREFAEHGDHQEIADLLH